MDDVLREFSRIYQYQGRVHIQRFGATESILRTGGGMSDSPLQRLSVPNKLHLIFTPASWYRFFSSVYIYMFTTVVCSFLRQGTADAALSLDFIVL